MSTEPRSTSEELQFAEFLTEYFVECDEHLSIARRSLLTLETSLQDSKVDRALLDELFRNFHSLKGLSAMVGFHEAEQLAHHLETYLGVVRKNHAALTLPGLEALITGVATLEQIIAARRDRQEPPDVSQLMSQLEVLLPIHPPTIDAS